jgi:hypothetical protein
MRLAIAVMLIAPVLWPTGAQAYENFIPLGHAYSLENTQLPPLNSAQSQFTSQVDIYQTEIYKRELNAKKFQTEIDQFQSHQHRNGPSAPEFIDY